MEPKWFGYPAPMKKFGIGREREGSAPSGSTFISSGTDAYRIA